MAIPSSFFLPGLGVGAMPLSLSLHVLLAQLHSEAETESHEVVVAQLLPLPCAMLGKRL